jgi:hypothetical protein
MASQTFNFVEVKKLNNNQENLVAKRAFIEEAFISKLHGDAVQGGINVGSGEGEVFQQRVGDLLAFKTLTAGENVGIINEKDTIVLSAAGTTAANVGAGEGEVFRDKSGDQLNFRTLSAGTNVSIATNSDTVTINASGDVVGPASSTNNAIALFDGTTGKLLKQSSAPAVIDASNNMSGVNDLTLTGNLNIPVSNGAATQGMINVTGVGPSFYVPNATSIVAGPNSGSPAMLGGTVNDTIIIGADAGLLLQAGSGPNTFIGRNAGRDITVGVSNIAIGSFAFQQASTQNRCIAIGQEALNSLDGDGVSTSDNIAIGHRALASTNAGVVTNDQRNVVIGSQAMENSGGGLLPCESNVCIGYQVLLNTGTASGNVVIGAGAAGTPVTANDNIIIGATAGGAYITGTVERNIIIGNTGDSGDSDTIRIGSTQNRNFQAGILGALTGPNTPVFIDTATGQLTDTNISSIKYKEQVESLTINASDILVKLRPVSFFYKSQQDRSLKAIGLIAEEVDSVYPSLVLREKDGKDPRAVKYQDLPIFLLKAFQEAHVRSQKQQEQIDKLETLVHDLQQRIQACIAVKT